MFRRGGVARAEIRPVPRPEAEYNEHLSPRIVYGLAANYNAGTADAAVRPGIEAKNYQPYLTIQDFIVPAGSSVHGL